MKNIIIVSILFLIVSCYKKEIHNDETNHIKKYVRSQWLCSAGHAQIYLVTIDSCQYIVNSQGGIIHKANCNHK